ncbi:MAG: hypothetical protein ABIH99_01955, partial [Candidatus Micrarchaeota archaeon]
MGFKEREKHETIKEVEKKPASLDLESIKKAVITPTGKEKEKVHFKVNTNHAKTTEKIAIASIPIQGNETVIAFLKYVTNMKKEGEGAKTEIGIDQGVVNIENQRKREIDEAKEKAGRLAGGKRKGWKRR